MKTERQFYICYDVYLFNFPKRINICDSAFTFELSLRLTSFILLTSLIPKKGREIVDMVMNLYLIINIFS
jgi:hypothetical protein